MPSPTGELEIGAQTRSRTWQTRPLGAFLRVVSSMLYRINDPASRWGPLVIFRGLKHAIAFSRKLPDIHKKNSAFHNVWADKKRGRLDPANGLLCSSRVDFVHNSHFLETCSSRLSRIDGNRQEQNNRHVIKTICGPLALLQRTGRNQLATSSRLVLGRLGPTPSSSRDHVPFPAALPAAIIGPHHLLSIYGRPGRRGGGGGGSGGGRPRAVCPPRPVVGGVGCPPGYRRGTTARASKRARYLS